MSALFGNGDGTFANQVDYDMGPGATPSSLVVADFNLDGKPDLAVAEDPNSIVILLGNCSP